MQKYRGLLSILLLLGLVLGAAAASVAWEDSAPTVAAVIRRVVVVLGAALVLTIWGEWRDSREKKKQAATVENDAS